MTIEIIPLLKKQENAPKTTRLVIMGLTPGHVQHEAIDKATKPRFAAFKGVMRTHIFNWFEQLGINSQFQIGQIDSIYTEDRFDDLVYTTSLLRDPVYKNGKNYTGRSPLPWKDEALSKMMQETFKRLEDIEGRCLIVPLGDVVSQAIIEHSRLDQTHSVLHGFPHPSGANGHKHIKFANAKEDMLAILKKHFV